MWASGRVLRFLTLYTVLMSVTAYLLATNNDLKLVTMKASVVVAVTSTITFGLFIGLVIGARASVASGNGPPWSRCSSRRRATGRSCWASSSQLSPRGRQHSSCRCRTW